MNSFWPTGPWTITEMTVSAALAILLLVRGRPGEGLLALALFVSWAGARTATAYEDAYAALAGWAIAALFAAQIDTRASMAVAGLYVVRCFSLTVLLLPVVDWFWFWEINRVLLWLQFMLIAGTFLPNRGKIGSIPRYFLSRPAYFTLRSRSGHVN